MGMSESAPIVTFDQVKGAIGSLILLWSDIERELVASIRKMHAGEMPKSAHGILGSLKTWSHRAMRQESDDDLHAQLCRRLVDLLEDALTIRNLVCHGLIGIHAQIGPTDVEAHLTVELGGDKRILRWDELQEMFAWMSRTKWLIRDLTDVALSENLALGNKKLVGWESFPLQK